MFGKRRKPPREPKSFLGERLIIPAGDPLFRQDKTFAYEVIREDADRVEIATNTVLGPSMLDPNKAYGRWLPKSAWAHMKADLLGRVPEATVVAAEYTRGSGDPAVDAVLAWAGSELITSHSEIQASAPTPKAYFLAKGNDGVIWRVTYKDGRSEIVKGSTTVPFQPLNPGHRTPEDAASAALATAQLAQALVRAGVPGILVPRVVFVGAGPAAKVFVVRPDLRLLKSSHEREPTENWNKDRVDQAATTISGMLENGISLNDTIQAGLLVDAPKPAPAEAVYLFDLGQARPLPTKPQGRKDAINSEITSLRRLYEDNGLEYMPPPEARFLLDLIWDSVKQVAASAEDPRWQKGLNLYMAQKALKQAEEASESLRLAGYPVVEAINRMRISFGALDDD